MKYRAIFRIYGLIIANMLLIMGGQLGYLYIVGPISMEDGGPMTLPEIPFLGLLVIIMNSMSSCDLCLYAGLQYVIMISVSDHNVCDSSGAT